MKITTENMVDIMRLNNMAHGEVFIWHIQQHLEKNDKPVKQNAIPPGKVGCKICCRTVTQIFHNDRENYHKDINRKYSGD